MERALYIYGLKDLAGELNEQDYGKIEEREMQFDEADFPKEHVYCEILNFFEFISNLMIRWKILIGITINIDIKAEVSLSRSST